MRRARISWLLNSGAPTGRTMMAARRMAVLGEHHEATGFTLEPPPRMPRDSPLRVLRSARSLSGEARLARSDVIVATSESSAASAVTRARRGTRLVYVLHDDPRYVCSTVRFMQSAPHLAHVVVPLSVDPSWFAATAGLDRRRVTAMDDFVPETESLLGTAQSCVALLASGVRTCGRDAVEAFGIADLPGWQLRILGAGATELDADVEAAGLRGRVVLPGPSFGIAAHHADAGVVVALDPDDVNGLPVLEALAAGVPVLGSAEVPAVRRFVRDGHNGVVLSRTDPIAIAEGLVRIADQRLEFAARARSDRAGLLTSSDATALHELFARVLDDAPPRGRQ